jgi:hypothetical protein
MARLAQLSDGTWIDPATVRMVVAEPRDRHGNPPRVVVWSYEPGPSPRVLACESREDAEAMRDEIAGIVNAARED